MKSRFLVTLPHVREKSIMISFRTFAYFCTCLVRHIWESVSRTIAERRILIDIAGLLQKTSKKAAQFQCMKFLRR